MFRHMAAVRYPESGGAYRSARANARENGEPVTQERLAVEVGVASRTVIRYENGEFRPSPAIRDRIADFLGVDPDSLPAAGEDPFARSAIPMTTRSSRGFAARFTGWFTRRLR